MLWLLNILALFENMIMHFLHSALIMLFIVTLFKKFYTRF